jgi:hypothetical protein
VSSYGFDPALCGLGGVAYNGGDQLADGLRVPTAPTSQLAQQYLFQLATMKLTAGQCVSLTGIGQLLTIGLDTNTGTPPIYPLKQNVTTPDWRFADVLPVTWALRVVRQPPLIPFASSNVLSTDSFAWRWSDTPSLVYETATFPAGNLNWNGTPDNYTALTGYTSPYNGQIIGEPIGDFGNWNTIAFPWNARVTPEFEPVKIEGPGAIVFYAQVPQTNPATRAKITVPGAFPVPPTGIPEEGFLADWPAAAYWSIAGSFEVML